MAARRGLGWPGGRRRASPRCSLVAGRWGRLPLRARCSPPPAPPVEQEHHARRGQDGALLKRPPLGRNASPFSLRRLEAPGAGPADRAVGVRSAQAG